MKTDTPTEKTYLICPQCMRRKTIAMSNYRRITCKRCGTTFRRIRALMAPGGGM